MVQNKENETIQLRVGFRAFDKAIGGAYNYAADAKDDDLCKRLYTLGRVNDRRLARGNRRVITVDKETYKSAVRDAIDLVGAGGDADLVEQLMKLDEHTVEAD